MTSDEELILLEDNIRKLKVEYDVYFAGGARKPPEDLEWRIRNTLKKFADGRALNLQQHFRYNTLAQKFAVFSDLWRRKLKIKVRVGFLPKVRAEGASASFATVTFKKG